MKYKIKSGVTLLVFCFCFVNSLFSFNPKYSNWQSAGFYRGFNVLNENIKTQQDFFDLRNSGANFAQLGCFGFNEVTFPYSLIQSNINEMDSLVSFCRNAGIHYAIAVRQGPGRRDVYLESNYLASASTIWTNSVEQQLYAGMLKSIALRYSNDSLFAGINMIVEPNPMFDSPYIINPTLLQFGLNSNGIDLNTIYNTIIDSIRSADAFLPVIAENVAYSNPEYFSIMQPVNDPYIVYDFHCYAPQQFTGESVPFAQTYPGDYFSMSAYSIQQYNKSFLETVTLQNIIAFQQLTSAPVIMGEFGLKNPQNGGELFLSDLADIAVCQGWHFALWDYRRGSSEWNYEQMGNSYWTTVQNMFVANCSELGVNETQKNKLQINIFPNPSDGKFEIVSQNENADFGIKVLDARGKMVYESMILQSHASVDLTFLNSGMYFYLLQNEQGIIGSGKIVIQ
ncbi:hypothetical protein BH09BAC5_BH09BAC5_09430 [soil metagenome]